MHFNLAPQGSRGKYTVLREAEDLGSVKPFFFILWKYSDCSGKGHMPEKMDFLPEIGANSLSLLSVLILQDNFLPQISLPASKGHTGCVGSGFICLRLSYQNYTAATGLRPAVGNTLKQTPLPAAAPSLWATCLHSSCWQGCLLALPIPVQVPPGSPRCPASPHVPWLCPPHCLGFRWFDDTS